MKRSSSYHYKRWLIQAPLALTVIGFGACLVSEAAMYKYSGAATWDWVLYGTISLVVLNSGLSLLGDSVLHRARYERLIEQETE
ncbi:MAG: hypothetical protein AAF741_04105 [Bacteroidota bacterium]